MGNSSFDVSTGCDLQEVDNAVNQTNKELGNRFDFRGVKFEIDFKRDQALLTLLAPDPHKIRAIWDVLGSKMIKRGVPIKNLKREDIADAAGGNVKQEIKLQQGIDGDTARKIVKFLKEKKLKKTQTSVQGDQVRIISPSRDALQEVISLLKGEDWGMELTFGNYR